MFEKGSDHAIVVDVAGLSTLPSVVTDDLAGLRRKSRHGRGGRGGDTNVCLISLQNVLNDLDVLNILGGGFGL